MEIRRPDPPTDFDEVLALVQACDRAVYGDSDWTTAELREEWNDLDVSTDAWVAADEGRLAGVMHVYEPRDYEAWAKRTVEVEQFDPELFPVVWDGDEVAAVSLDYAKRMGDWGWIATLAVRPAWRRRGLGLALLHEGFRRLVGRGETVAALGVDSENPTGATRLYERAGMHVVRRSDTWERTA